MTFLLFALLALWGVGLVLAVGLTTAAKRGDEIQRRQALAPLFRQTFGPVPEMFPRMRLD